MGKRGTRLIGLQSHYSDLQFLAISCTTLAMPVCRLPSITSRSNSRHSSSLQPGNSPSEFLCIEQHIGILRAAGVARELGLAEHRSGQYLCMLG